MGEAAVSGWNRMARVLHWGTAFAIAVEAPAGLIMSWTYVARDPAGKASHLLSSQVHHTLGLLLLIAVAFRIAWRLTLGHPPLPAHSSRSEVALAACVQGLLYLLLLALPLSGWAALSSMAAGAGYPAPELWFFGLNGFGPHGFIPHIVPPVPWNAPVLLKYRLFAHIHVWCLWLGGALLALHVAGALKHHLINRNDVLTRMWKGI
ncbi:cytochrome b/b6 domain-containing protein [Novosphingobium sp.]|uniref:cytochrome b n=1 Tax=Novosphingobium sp. TaxID=1874826 RepID=UPI0031D8D4C7